MRPSIIRTPSYKVSKNAIIRNLTTLILWNLHTQEYSGIQKRHPEKSNNTYTLKSTDARILGNLMTLILRKLTTRILWNLQTRKYSGIEKCYTKKFNERYTQKTNDTYLEHISQNLWNSGVVTTLCSRRKKSLTIFSRSRTL